MKRDTLSLLDELERFGLDDRAFRTLHHFGPKGHLKAFRSFAERVSNFKPHGCNQLLHARLAHMLDLCHKGELNRGKTMSDLAAAAMSAIHCRDYPDCRKHAIDRTCGNPTQS